MSIGAEKYHGKTFLRAGQGQCSSVPLQFPFIFESFHPSFIHPCHMDRSNSFQQFLEQQRISSIGFTIYLYGPVQDDTSIYLVRLRLITLEREKSFACDLPFCIDSFITQEVLFGNIS